MEMVRQRQYMKAENRRFLQILGLPTNVNANRPRKVGDATNVYFVQNVKALQNWPAISLLSLRQGSFA